MINLYLALKPLTSLFKIEIDYQGKIPKDKKIILVSNHLSNLDAILFSKITNQQIHFLAKEELFKGLFKYFFQALGCIPVNRSGQGMESIKQAINYLNQDKIIFIFPEGTINKTNNLILPFKLGTVIIAKKSKADIIPCCIKGQFHLRKNNLKIKIGQTITTSDYNTKDLLEKVENEVKHLIKT